MTEVTRNSLHGHLVSETTSSLIHLSNNAIILYLCYRLELVPTMFVCLRAKLMIIIIINNPVNYSLIL